MSANYKLEHYNDDEVWALHLVGDCPYDCPFCFDETEFDEEIEEEYRNSYDDYEPPLMDDEY